MIAEQKAVLAANAAFYDAFAARDVQGMDELWARRVPVVCIHPGWQPLHGRDAVIESWRQILEGPAPPAIRCSREMVYLLGAAAFVVCHEDVHGAELVATNVFVLEDGSWRMVQHHAGGVAHPEADSTPPPGSLH